MWAMRVAATGGFLAAFAFAREARSFCRTVTRAPPAGWNPASQGCFVDPAGDAKEVFWKSSCVGYSLQSQASRLVTLDQATAVVATAFQAWTSAACAEGGVPSVNAVDLGPVECRKVQYNQDGGNQNVIFFHDDEWPHTGSDSTLGLTTVTFDTATGELLGADMEINATQNLVVGDAGTGGYNLESVITHEVGHFLGLAHSSESNAIMFAKYTAASRLASDDVQGICAIYTPYGTRATTAGSVTATVCDPRPPGGLISACSSPPGSTSDPGSTAAPSKSGGCSMSGRGHGAGVPPMLLMAALGVASLARRRRRVAACAVLVAGNLEGEIWVRTMGGVVGMIGQRVEGEAVLEIGQSSLLFLAPRSIGQRARVREHSKSRRARRGNIRSHSTRTKNGASLRRAQSACSSRAGLRATSRPRPV